MSAEEDDRSRADNRGASGGTPTLSDGSFSIGSNVWPGVSKLIEEMGELGQVLGKLLGTHGATDHWDGSDLRLRLHEEIADVRAALMFVIHHCDLDREWIGRRVIAKTDLFDKWQEDQ